MRRIIPYVVAYTIASTAALAQQGEITVSELRTEPYYNIINITGIATNQTDKKIALASIIFNLYDEENRHVGNAVAAIQGLGPRGQWKFAASAPVPFARYKLERIDVSY